MTVPARPDDNWRRIRLRPLPDYEPGEPDIPPRRWSSLRPPRGPQLTLVPPIAPVAPVAQPPSEPPPVPTVTLWQLLRRVLEVLDGRRPVGQLRTLLPDAAFEALLTRLRTARPGSRHVLRSLRTCYPSTSAVEVSAVITVTSPSGRDRVIAAAARFERSGEQWPCTVMRLL
jgi:hypothetical protein